ncbi:DUF1446 domain-containing protein [Polynucleobacter sp. IMCC30063]|uniref:acyclic terpene utilization AtuA family protein n=1 Tax=Polynucleobacter sp. IMCC30063 TaxID=2907298 RepID=UPI001F4846F5|nr:acyclic terpene utilization AtuA family protein [Polynucleobacter sp. IMCC30063]MCE7506455.1 DUF1446 domain-containing protein [Polynucleobacter sp. IMCC30063]
MPIFAVGCGAGFSGDRTDAAAPVVQTLIERGGPAAIIFENLAERTLASHQLAKRANPQLGYEPLLELELEPILAACLQHQITIVGNFGAANPEGAGKVIQALAKRLGLPSPRIAIVVGDSLDGKKVETLLRQHLGEQFEAANFVCANAYQGAREIANAILAGAQIVVTGRVADPSLTLGPAMAYFGWSDNNWNALAGATMAGHLLECGAQVTGGYFADPGVKDVPEIHNIGFPIAEIAFDGSCVITKASNTGGLVDERTVKEQLLYELHDPAAYITPDVVADITQATVTEIAPHRVRLSGVLGHPRTNTLKTNVFFDGGWFGEGEISYAGPNAKGRARLAMEILQNRLGSAMNLRFDLIGISSIFGDDANSFLKNAIKNPTHGEIHDVRLRVAGQHCDLKMIDLLLREVTALWTGGPAGGGGVRVAKRPRLSIQSCLIEREHVPATFYFLSDC